MQTQLCSAGRAATPLPPLPCEPVPEHSLSFLSLTQVQLIFNFHTHWDNLSWGDEGNLVPGCVGSLLSSCLGRCKTHSHLSLSNQAGMDLKISPVTDSCHAQIDLGFCFLSPTRTAQREGRFVCPCWAAPPIALTLESVLVGLDRANPEPCPENFGWTLQTLPEPYPEILAGLYRPHLSLALEILAGLSSPHLSLSLEILVGLYGPHLSLSLEDRSWCRGQRQSVPTTAPPCRASL